MVGKGTHGDWLRATDGGVGHGRHHRWRDPKPRDGRLRHLRGADPKHHARKNPDLVIERSEIRVVEMPILTKVVNRVEVVFDGAEPKVLNEEAK